MTENVLQLKAEYNNLVSGLRQYAKYAADPHYDKKGIGFGIDSRFQSGGKLETSLDSYAGVYGSSSCSSVIYGLGPAFARHLLQEINSDVELLLLRVAERMRAELATHAKTERKLLKQQLAEVEAWEATT